MSQYLTSSLSASRPVKGVVVVAGDLEAVSLGLVDRLVAGPVVLLTLLVSVLILT